MGAFKKYVTCIMAFFIPFTFVALCQCYYITSPVLFTKINKLWNKRKEDFFVYMAAWAYHYTSKEVDTAFLDTIAFLDTDVCINSP